MLIKSITTSHAQVPVLKNGFTLIEMAISLMIVGIIASSTLFLYEQYLQNKQSTKTLEAVSNISTALFEYKNANGHYPCPAPLLEPRETSISYGHKTKCDDPKIGTGADVQPGTCLNASSGNNGVCVESSTRLIGGVHPRVRVGAVPFRDLQIDEKDTFDGYGSRIVYALTESMGEASTYKDSAAAIEITDGKGNILSGGDKSVAFVVLSPGKNRNGAVNTEGSAQPCIKTATDMDGGNCRDFASTTDKDAIYVMDAQASGSDQFDDIVEYFVPTGSEVWRRQGKTPENSENIIDMSEDKVGVGIATASQLTNELTIKQSTVNNVSKVDPLTGKDIANLNYSRGLSATNAVGGQYQSGGLRVGKYDAGTETGKILADNFCGEDGVTDCFSTDIIAGTYDGNPTSGTSGLGCPPGLYMQGIVDGHAKCGSVRIACPPGQVMQGLKASGGPDCVTPAGGCEAQVVSLCGENQTLEEGGSGQTRVIRYEPNGKCAWSEYTCNAGTWVRTEGRDGDDQCNWDPANIPTWTETSDCKAGYTGSYEQHYQLACRGEGEETTNNAGEVCVCVGLQANVECSGDFGSSIVGTKQRVCTGNVLDEDYTVIKDNDGNTYASEGALLAAKCACPKADYYEFSACGDGQERVSSPNPPSFTNPTAAWPEDTKIGVYTLHTADASSCTYNSAGANASNCACATGYNYRDETPDCPSCKTVDTFGKVRQVRSGAGCSWIDDTDISGNTEGTCKTTNFIWKNSGVSAGPSNALKDGHGSSPECNTSCTCGQATTKGVCAISTASQWTYFSSTCLPAN